jgi:hypothetical protein
MVMDHAPLMSVVVAKLLPVRLFLAVTATPGSGILPEVMTPWRVPPVIVAAGAA